LSFNSLDCGRIHLQRRIEDEEQCGLLIKDLQALIRHACTAEIQEEEVLHEDYIRRVLRLRKVTIATRSQIGIQTSLTYVHIIFFLNAGCVKLVEASVFVLLLVLCAYFQFSNMEGFFKAVKLPKKELINIVV